MHRRPDQGRCFAIGGNDQGAIAASHSFHPSFDPDQGLPIGIDANLQLSEEGGAK
jgi:hypothetical protein